ncbi:ligand-dependent nuclear receptor-interacting factor 1 [Kryptolebias marmoratus]|uniref:ligand-dependent nuclear receptor-interacting factor 1 n=1 Tax=Kryptolebias marmoratus TaxID=37003 RepID=UPI0007F88745|nr:ligand-dependent nuclear receptor-interacting factor 1 [Kryptolebias marmoratus]
MDALHSKTSIFYQATPAVGADGKNIMKLIPVKMVNGQLPQPEASQRFVTVYNHFSPAHGANKAAGTPSNRKQVSAADVLFSQIRPAHRDSKAQESLNVTTKAPLARLLRQFPVTVKSPALPRGQFLKIPPDAQVQRVLASELPTVIKDQIFTSSAGSSASPTVVYVSPVTTVDQGAPGPPPSRKLSSNAPAGAEPQLKLVPKFSERANSPIRWVIEEAESPSPASEEPRSGVGIHRQTDNALVVYNGRVFFVANKNGSSLKSTAAPQSIVPSVPPTRQNRSDVIDLCEDDDDAQKDAPRRALSPVTPVLSHQDEDNVIFVSYIPPKPESDSSQTVPAEVPAQRAGGQQGTDVTETQQLDMDTGSPADHSGREESAQTAQTSKAAAPSWTSPAAPEPGHGSDHQLRKMFGITADVKIFLQKVDEAAESKTSEDEELSPWGSYSPNVLPEHELSEALHTRNPPLNGSSFNLNPEPPSGLEDSWWSGPRRLSEAEPAVGYVEPIDEDFSDESDIQSKPKDASVHLQAETCVDISTSTRRMGRTRKRTLCPCCVPAALHPAVKSGLQLEELERWMFIAEQTGRKAGRTKAPRKDGRTSAKISYRNCEIHEAPGSGGLSLTSADSLKTSSG